MNPVLENLSDAALAAANEANLYAFKLRLARPPRADCRLGPPHGFSIVERHHQPHAIVAQIVGLALVVYRAGRPTRYNRGTNKKPDDR